MASKPELRSHLYAIARELGVNPETNPILSLNIEGHWATLRYVNDEGKVVRFKTEYPNPVTGMQGQIVETQATATEEQNTLRRTTQ